MRNSALDCNDCNISAIDISCAPEASAIVEERPVIATPLEIIEEARQGRMYILIDDEERENEGDLIIPAPMATAEAINFMAKYGRGLICLALSPERVERLDLQMMSKMNQGRHETAFTVSIEAREGVTTGISASDRATTIQAAVHPDAGPESLVSPGHIFPLAARKGGVLTRAGHTEAAVDISRLAGLDPSGVICEIMNEDGTMARLDDLVEFAQTHGLKIGTIRDLIAYRRVHDSSIQEIAEFEFTSRWGGNWTAKTLRSGATQEEQIALVKGEISADKPTLVRVHALSVFSDILGEVGAREGLLNRAMSAIAEAGAGVVVLVSDHCTGSQPYNKQLNRNVRRSNECGEQRDYGVGAEILSYLGVKKVILITNSHHSMVALQGYDLSIVEEVQIP